MNNTPFLYISNPWRSQIHLHRERRISLYYTVLLMSLMMPQFYILPPTPNAYISLPLQSNVKFNLNILKTPRQG